MNEPFFSFPKNAARILKIKTGKELFLPLIHISFDKIECKALKFEVPTTNEDEIVNNISETFQNNSVAFPLHGEDKLS